MKQLFYHYLRLLLAGATLVGWALFIWAMIVYHHARPEMQTLLTELYQLDVRKEWLAPLRGRLWWLLWFCCVVSLCSLVLNRYLVSHHQGRYWFSILLLLSISLASLLLLQFGLPAS